MIPMQMVCTCVCCALCMFVEEKAFHAIPLSYNFVRITFRRFINIVLFVFFIHLCLSLFFRGMSAARQFSGSLLKVYGQKKENFLYRDKNLKKI